MPLPSHRGGPYTRWRIRGCARASRTHGAGEEGKGYLLVDGDFEQFVILERLGAEHQAIIVLGEVARGGAAVVGEGDAVAASPMEHVVRRAVCAELAAGPPVLFPIRIGSFRVCALLRQRRRWRRHSVKCLLWAKREFPSLSPSPGSIKLLNNLKYLIVINIQEVRIYARVCGCIFAD